MKKLLIILALCAVPAACKIADVATPTQEQQLATIEQERLDALLAGDADAAAAADQKRKDLESEIGTGFFRGVLDWVDGFLPIPLEPFKSEMAAGLALLLFERPRKHILAALKSATKADPKEVLASTLKALGLKHSSEDPLGVLRAAAKVARKQGKEEIALEIEAAIAKIEAAAALIAPAP